MGMSKKIKTFIRIPKEVSLSFYKNYLICKSPKGLEFLKISFNIERKDNKLFMVKNKNKSLNGTFFSNLKNTLKGLELTHQKQIFLVGIGFQVEKKDNILIFKLGYSHKIFLEIPERINVIILKKNSIAIIGVNKDQVSSFSRKIQFLRKPEPFKGKGILFK